MNKKGRYISIRCRLQLQHCVDNFFMPTHDTPGKNDLTFNSCQNDFTTQMKSMINRFHDISANMTPGLAAMVKPSIYISFTNDKESHLIVLVIPKPNGSSRAHEPMQNAVLQYHFNLTRILHSATKLLKLHMIIS